MSALKLTPVQRPLSRNGVGASCVVLPPGRWPRLVDYLVEKFPHVSQAVWLARLAKGEVLDAALRPLNAKAPFTAHERIFYFRASPQETVVPFKEHILFEDEDLLVADKPHFLSVTPTGSYVQESLLVRLKKTTKIEDLSPLHRIDRDTAGLVLFSKRAATRGLYQALFRQRAINKVYEAIAPWTQAHQWPNVRSNRIGPSTAHFMQQVELPHAGHETEWVNAITHIDCLERLGTHQGTEWARYRLQPITGQRHQLRVHMAALGLPICNDGIYPTLTPEGSTNWEKPLQLLAQQLAFTHPTTGQVKQWHSTFALELT